MKSLATAQEEAKRALWQGAVAHSRDEFLRDRPMKVTLCVMIFSEVEVVANIHSADERARQLADKATVKMHTAPAAMRFHVQKRVDPKDEKSALEWVEVVHTRVDPNDASSPWAWQLKK